MCHVLCFFFFQAEDGIRDDLVTGVQTCALPILFPCLGDHTIAIDEAVQDHLQKYFRRGIKKLSLIRNGIEIQPSPPAPLPNQGEGGRRPGEGEVDNRVLYLGRLTGGRWRALKFFFEVLKRSGASLPKTCYQIVGRIPEERAGE